MKTTCHDIQEKLMQEQALAAAEQTHLATCLDCRSFADVLNCLPDLREGSSPPSTLDRTILAAAFAKSPQARPRLLLLKPLLLAAAAMIVVAIGAWYLHSPEATEKHQPPVIAKDMPERPTYTADTDAEAMMAWDYDVVESKLLVLEAELVMLDDLASPAKVTDQIL